MAEICAVRACYAAWSGNPLLMCWDNISVPSSRVKKSSWTFCLLKVGPIHCSKMSVKDYHSTLHNIPEECRSHQHLGRSLKSKAVAGCRLLPVFCLHHWQCFLSSARSVQFFIHWELGPFLRPCTPNCWSACRSIFAV
jgi:hypothetical protein